MAVEVQVRVVPLDTKVMLSTVLQRLIDRLNVLVAAHRTNPRLSVWVHWSIMEVEASCVPSLSDLWIDVSSYIVASVNGGHDGGIHEGRICLKGVLKHDLQVAVESKVDISDVGGKGRAIRLDEFLGEALSFTRLIGPEIKSAAGVSTDSVDPCFEVYCGEDLVHSLWIASD